MGLIEFKAAMQSIAIKHSDYFKNMPWDSFISLSGNDKDGNYIISVLRKDMPEYILSEINHFRTVHLVSK